ncbi:hypothetical protein C8F01DRAFT_92918 [Mycena amicta]|nr:hypothetical protein C8F01DRAFT_92918 [Mycena amicta]
MVTDPDALCGRHREKRQPVAEKYIRVYPPIESTSANDSTKPPIAHLTLPPYAYVGDGNHSRAYSANLTLDDRFTLLEHSQSTTPTRTWGLATVQVVAKVTSRHSEDRKMLATEAKMYTSMLQRRAHLSEHWSGFNAIDEASESNEHVGNDTRVPATAVLPQFYGYYIPAAGSSSTGRPIMLLEHCGAQIDLSGMSKPEKTTCYTFLERLWSAGIMQNSFYARNIVMKPGPLTHPPDLRSFDEPSFRIIDFGRGEWLSKAQRQHDWERMSSQQERALKLERAMAVDAIYGGTRRYKYR